MDTLFFWISKLYWLIFSPGSLLVLLLVLNWFLFWRRYTRAARRLLTGLVLAVLLIAYLPVGEWLLHPLEQRFDAPDPTARAPDGILLVGGSFSLSISESHNQPELSESADRMLAFLSLAQRYPDARLAFSGGTGSLTNQRFKEADVVEQMLYDFGVDVTRLRMEDQSRNTWENARNSLALVRPEPGERWLLITSAFHMPRTFGAFCQLDWLLQPFPVDYRTPDSGLLYYNFDFASHLGMLNLAVREWTGLLAYRLTGKTSNLVPGPQDNCET